MLAMTRAARSEAPPLHSLRVGLPFHSRNQQPCCSRCWWNSRHVSLARTHSGRAQVTERTLRRCCKASDMDGCVKENQETNPEKYVFIGEYAGRVAGAPLKPSGTDTELGDKASDGGSMEPPESMQVRSLPEGSTTFLRMEFLMTPDAERDEVLFGIGSQLTPRVDVVNLEIGRSAAALAAPAVPLQHMLAQLTIGLWVKAEPGPARYQTSHEAFLSCSKNCFCCGGGRN